MNFKEILNQHSSRKLVDDTIILIGNNRNYFNTVLELSFSEPYPICMRASWVIMHYCNKNPDYIQPHLDYILKQILLSKIDGVKRNYIKVFAEYAILEKIENLGLLIDLCFKLFNNPAEAIAIRAFCLDVLIKIAKNEPELIPEIKESITFQTEHFSAGLKNKAYKVLQKIEKQSIKSNKKINLY